MAAHTLLGESAVLLHPVYDVTADVASTVTGQSGSISATAYLPDGTVSGVTVTAAEVGVTGWYTLTFTPTVVGEWRVEDTGQIAVGRATPQGAGDAVTQYQVSVAAAGVSTGGNLLTTRALVKRRLGLTATTYDDLIDDILAEVSARVQDEIGRPILQATYTEYYDGHDSEVLFLRHGPLVSVTSCDRVSYGDDGGGGRQETLTAVAAYERLEGGLVTGGHLGRGWIRFTSAGRVFDRGSANWRVVYSAGFSAVPATLSHAAVIESVREFNVRELHGLRSRTVGETTVDPSAPLTADSALMRVIKPYLDLGLG